MKLNRPWIFCAACPVFAAGALLVLPVGCNNSSNGDGTGQGQQDEWSNLAGGGDATAPVGDDTVTSTSDDGRFTIETPSTPGLPGEAVDGEPVTTASGLQYYVLQEGDGDSPPDISSYVKVNYAGYLPNGQNFDRSADGVPSVFQLDGVVPGFGEGLLSMKIGEKRKLLIPGQLGFGPQSVPTPSGITIPPNSPLIFDVELVAVPDYVSDPATWPGEDATSAWTNLESGARYVQLKPGSGEGALVADSAAQVHVEGWLTTGDQFLNTLDREDGPTTIYLPTLPTGWAEAMYGMKPGEKRKIVLPAEHAFGDAGDPQLGVPGGATVIADIELTGIDPYISIPATLPGDPVTGAPVNLPTGVSYYVMAEGEGEATAEESSFVSLTMHGWLNDGTEITAQSPEEPTEALLRDMFPGIKDALTGMKVGGKRKIVLPYDQGAGAAGRAPLIPPKSTVIFEIELVDIDRYARTPEELPGDALAGDPTSMESGGQYWVLQPGDGADVLEDSGVQVKMNGYLNDGRKITADEPMYALRSQMMPGLAAGVLGAKVGEKRKVVIPWDQALGDAGNQQGGVPAKAMMIVDVEIVDVDPFIELPEQLPGEPIRGLPTNFESGVTTYDLANGTGETMTDTVQTVQVKLTTYRADGTILQGFSSPLQAATLPMDVAPPGLKEGMAGMQVGGKRKIVMPWEQAFGLEGNLQMGIPAKMSLVIDIELAGIVPQATVPTPPDATDDTNAAPDDDAADAAGGDDDSSTGDGDDQTTGGSDGGTDGGDG